MRFAPAKIMTFSKMCAVLDTLQIEWNMRGLRLKMNKKNYARNNRIENENVEIWKYERNKNAS